AVQASATEGGRGDLEATPGLQSMLGSPGAAPNESNSAGRYPRRRRPSGSPSSASFESASALATHPARRTDGSALRAKSLACAARPEDQACTTAPARPAQPPLCTARRAAPTCKARRRSGGIWLNTARCALLEANRNGFARSQRLLTSWVN